MTVRRVGLVVAAHGRDHDGVREYALHLGEALTCHVADTQVLTAEQALTGRPMTDVLVLNHTHLAWARRGFPVDSLRLARRLRRRCSRLLVVIHDPLPFEGSRVRDLIRRRTQLAAMRKLATAADAAVVTIPKERIGWTASVRAISYIPVGTNIAVHGTQRTPSAGFRLVVFGLTGHRPDEWQSLVRISRAVAAELGQVELVATGGGTDGAREALNRGLAGSAMQLRITGPQPEETVSKLMSESDVQLFLRAEVSSRRSTVVAGLAHGLPIVGYSGVETAGAITDAGLVLAPLGDEGSVVRHVVTLARDPDLRRSLGQRSRDVFERHFAWPVIAGQFAELIGTGC